MRQRLDEARLAFLRAGYPLMSVSELTSAFNRYFGDDKTEKAIKAALSNHKIKAGRRGPGNQIGKRKYSIEHLEFIRIRYKEIGLRELVAELREYYGIRTTVRRLGSICKNHGITSGRTGQFEKGHVPWTAGTKGMGLIKPNSGQFEKGSSPANLKPIGFERVNREGLVEVKVDEINPYTGFCGRFRPKHVVIWEQHQGKRVPRGHVVIFRDGDNRNFDPANLDAITKALNVRLNQLRISQYPKEMRETIRGVAEIRNKIGSLRRSA